jgi:mannose-6-phosphate isomerase-like protein (cupin superfamily)
VELMAERVSSHDLGFVKYEWRTGKVANCDPNFPSILYSWDGAPLKLESRSAFFGFVADGPAELRTAAGSFTLSQGMYFAADDTVEVKGGRGIVVERVSGTVMFMLGGPVETDGRLKYIDGCTDSLLVPPVRMGDPCLNLLSFPTGIDQTMHTHPSDRIGLVYSGAGVCITPQGETQLTPGTIFRIPAEGLHKFRTNQSRMRVIAYHPDSDFGPTDEVHPMVNRTVVDGVSASLIDKLRTK